MVFKMTKQKIQFEITERVHTHSQHSIQFEYTEQTIDPITFKMVDVKTYKIKPKKIVESLKDYLEDLAENFKFCKGCGGILPELSFVHKKKLYRFVCYEIHNYGRGKGYNLIAETNYPQLAKHLNSQK